MKAPLLTRREFLRMLPRHLVKKFGAVVREGLFDFSSNAEKKTVRTQDLVAQVEVARCHAWTGLICQQCYLACPKRDRAIEMRDQKPVIIASVCDGCAMCVTACEMVNDLPAIRMVPPPALSADGGSQAASRHEAGGGMVSRMPVSFNIAAEKEVAS